MPREGKKGKVTGVVRIASGLEGRSGGFLGKAPISVQLSPSSTDNTSATSSPHHPSQLTITSLLTEFHLKFFKLLDDNNAVSLGL